MFTAILKMIWALSGQYNNNGDIGVLVDIYLAEEFGWDADERNEVKTAVYQGLNEITNDIYTENDCKYGYCVINGTDCYWWSTNASFEWTSDRPDFWDEMLEKQEEDEE